MTMSGPLLLALRIILALSLYVFLGWAIWILWRDLNYQSKSLSDLFLPAITLTRKDIDPNEPLTFSSPELTIGRDPACDIFFQDKTISAQHARISFHHNHWWIEDLNSRNGTMLNSESVLEPLVLTSGDALKCGQIDFEVMIGATDVTS